MNDNDDAPYKQIILSEMSNEKCNGLNLFWVLFVVWSSFC